VQLGGHGFGHAERGGRARHDRLQRSCPALPFDPDLVGTDLPGAPDRGVDQGFSTAAVGSALRDGDQLLCLGL